MKTNKLRCKPASIPKTRWVAYAAAGAATALAGSQSAEAAIHYSGLLDEKFRPNSHKTFPLDQPGDSLLFAHHRTACSEADFNIKGIVSASIRGSTGYCLYVSKLSFGQNISSGNFVHTFSGTYRGRGMMAINPVCFYSTGGQWFFGGTGYVGFRFNSGAGIQYGWARVRMEGGLPLSFKLLAYAYADPGEPITAGQRRSDEQAPDEGSLGWLAVGAAGLLAWRKSRSRSACYTRPSLPA
jgi:hypothetical protein